ncbi:hypothetical protein [Chitinimonas sp. BJYL2]|uniref:hypothetical protein n=1 Tax=Chitinimonas sp. BJYL2 TaxID=2976696 RepID=UPI0022B588E4|nr:hypothetical protein [Chitinimonas sp. BJYL2]
MAHLIERLIPAAVSAPTLVATPRRAAWGHWLGASASAVLLACSPATSAGSQSATLTPAQLQARYEAGQQLFEEKCRTEAGIRIYRKVEKVEGILLQKIRTDRGDRSWTDPMWVGAANTHDSTDDGYINSFLGYEHSSDRVKPVSPESRGYITPDYQPGNPSNVRGYRYVEVEDGGQRWRYSGSMRAVGKKDIHAPNVVYALKQNPNMDLNVYRWVLDKTPAAGPAPRYAVTFEDHVIPEHRKLWVASTTIKVLDLQAKETMAEFTRFVWSQGGVSPWLRVRSCPRIPGSDSDNPTRKFVDQVLIPKQEETK